MEKLCTSTKVLFGPSYLQESVVTSHNSKIIISNSQNFLLVKKEGGVFTLFFPFAVVLQCSFRLQNFGRCFYAVFFPVTMVLDPGGHGRQGAGAGGLVPQPPLLGAPPLSE